jgi:hypothetical protein
VLDVGAFDLERALAVDSTFLEPQYPFEWAGLYDLAAGRHELRPGGDTHDHHHHEHHHDGECDHDHHHENEHHDEHHGHDHAHEGGLAVALLSAGAGEPATSLADCIEPAVRAFAEEGQQIVCGGTLKPANTTYRIDVGHDGSHFHIDIASAGRYALVVEHAPIEFGLRIEGVKPIAERRFASHHHDEEISSIGLTDPRAVDANKLNDWLSYLLKSRGADIFRMKGVVSIKGEPRRYVFHGVHMMFDGQLERPWPAGVDRVNTLVFIGRNLDRQELEAGFHSCFA